MASSCYTDHKAPMPQLYDHLAPPCHRRYTVHSLHFRSSPYHCYPYHFCHSLCYFFQSLHHHLLTILVCGGGAGWHSRSRIVLIWWLSFHSTSISSTALAMICVYIASITHIVALPCLRKRSFSPLACMLSSFLMLPQLVSSKKQTHWSCKGKTNNKKQIAAKRIARIQWRGIWSLHDCDTLVDPREQDCQAPSCLHFSAHVVKFLTVHQILASVFAGFNRYDAFSWVCSSTGTANSYWTLQAAISS